MPIDVTRYIGYSSVARHMAESHTITPPPSLQSCGSAASILPTWSRGMRTLSPHALELKLQAVQRASVGASYASVWLAALQALLGVVLTVVIFVWQLVKVNECRVLTVVVVVGFAIGITLVLLAYVVQAYVVSSGFTKTISAVAFATIANLAVLGVFAAFALPDQNTSLSDFCLVEFGPAAKWAAYLPITSSALLVLVSAASSALFFAVAYQLVIKARCSVLRELYNVTCIYRGISWMLVSGLFGAFLSIAVLVLEAVGGVDIGLIWLIQWVAMSRMLVAGLWRRLYTDSTAHKHPFWQSVSYYHGYLRYLPDRENAFINSY
ncbi:hypothetical protein LPJ60_001639 [Coemansia sp. RSA 2675]|nr:hypothetical protein LPJ60_001639 [Coemansia sp. RSA 2675]